MRILRMIYYFLVICLAIPLDYIIWNLNLVPALGYSTKSFKQIIAEHCKAYKEKIRGDRL